MDLLPSAQHLVGVSKREDVPIELVGSWTTEIGPVVDQAGNTCQHNYILIVFDSVHLWCYKGGYATMDSVWKILKNDKV